MRESMASSCDGWEKGPGKNTSRTAARFQRLTGPAEVTDQKYDPWTLPDSGGQFDRDTTRLRINRDCIQIKKDPIAPSRLIKDDFIVKREAQSKLMLPGLGFLSVDLLQTSLYLALSSGWGCHYPVGRKSSRVIITLETSYNGVSLWSLLLNPDPLLIYRIEM
ncbi:uncharacterized protein BO96DRAFT_431646 [Aspergillus niger CBS 101883]|uniref:uncharacterized protein n=1 Tax=Aspergillus lacticoffeatus (strain CBS 101883) TaxID=1450533 RepID=UPI000D7EC8C1|nr:uncharacterized protein BO96DRAFT_431646 [Aspergillus niger CBS 101883]PYH59499.1 hypothetical protein BO96DRAFT_431646 [Aspergillus niger CBS 101883]